jgi:hypothetical protein
MTLIETHKTRRLIQDEDLRAAEVRKLREALKMVYDLLEDYAPPWYGERIRDKAQAGLLVK